ncbi:MAG: hypothetical protein HQ567_18195 [Candidatus Nealsonbacteria bacterium]|nr:hypothetical protein [Candidatus Nealsonbacteria bacterium]
MYKSTIRRTTPGSCLVVIVLAAAAAVAEDADALRTRQRMAQQWYEVRQEVIEELPRRDVIQWSNQLASRLDGAGHRTLFAALEVFIRAGHEDRTTDVVNRLNRLELPPIIYHYVAEDHLIRRELWGPLRMLLDAHPECCPVYFEKFRRHWWETGDRAELESWLKTRYETDWRSWHTHYFWVLSEQGKIAALVERLEAEVRRKPTDGQLVFKYLAAAGTLADRIQSPEKRPDVAWLGDVARPRYAMDAHALGRRLADDEHYAQAIELLDHSLTRPITDYDKKAVQEECSKPFAEGEYEPTIRRWTKTSLARNCKEAGEFARAQKLTEELLGPDATLKDLGLVRFAGEVQRASGQRVIEGRIKKAEEENKDSIRYWLRRAAYYIGRQEDGLAEDAFKSALALPADGSRPGAVQQYAGFLVRKREYSRANELLREELERIGWNDGSAEYLVHDLLELDRRAQFKFRSDDPLLWRFLAERKGYDYREENVLRAFLNKFRASGNEQAFWDKVLKLAGPGSDPRRRFVVGKFLLHYDRAEQAVPLLEDALRRWAYSSLREQMGSTLLRAYLETGDWRMAEQMFRSLRSQKTFSDVRQCLADLALAAAKNADKDDSLRLWKERANLDLTDLEELNELAAAGMKKPLADFYSKLAKRDPNNKAVARALDILESKQ